ncbi:hypothetical protein XENOCAPTIV_021128 [Xenoophorus captivus]|uniref:Uncharacterized protein n=1 Tax=Xenoophorus captivus TaxID=1517983 RepID=A0ABV0RIC5_9TELE
MKWRVWSKERDKWRKGGLMGINKLLSNQRCGRGGSLPPKPQLTYFVLDLKIQISLKSDRDYISLEYIPNSFNSLNQTAPLRQHEIGKNVQEKPKNHQASSPP